MKKMRGFLALLLALAMACASLAGFAEEAQETELTEETPGGDGNNGKPTTDDAIIIENGTDGNFAVKIENTVLVDEKNQMANHEGVEFTYSEVDPATGDPVTITINGNLDTPSAAVKVNCFEQDSLLVSIDGNVTGDWRGVYLITPERYQQETTVNVTGNVTATGANSAGVDLQAKKGTGNVSVTGDVTGETRGVHINAGDWNSTASTVKVTGNVTANGDWGCGISTEGNGNISTTVGGDVTASGKGSVGAEIGCNGDLTITGDLSGEDTGLAVIMSGDRDILVEGTISGETGVECSDYFDGEDTDLTVWKIASTKEDATEADLVVNTSLSSMYGEALTEFCQTSIHYIVKLLQPAEGGTVSAQKENGDALDKHHELETAQEGDKVYVNVEAIDNYRILKALNGDTELDKDEGGFFCKVRRGGGILLTAILELIVQPEPEPEPQPQPRPEPKPAPVAKAGQARVGSAVKTVEVRDAENRISISFLSDGTFKVRMEDGTTEKGTYRNENGRLVLICGGSTVTVGGDGTFTYTSQQNPGKSYTFRLSPADMETLLKVAR